ncbi:unnamed protein product, partial [Rotaria sp. Silwood2]
HKYHLFKYNKIIPRLHAMQLSAAIGINRILVLTRMIDPPLMIQTSADSDDDKININQRQVIDFIILEDMIFV